MTARERGQATMVTKSTMKKAATPQRLAAACIAGLACLLGAQSAQAQEILMTGPLAGAPAVRKLRLYREGRFEIQPSVSFSILDEYNRGIFAGATLNYNFTDWIALGVWGTFGAVQMPTSLTENIEKYHATRNCGANADELNCRLTSLNMSGNKKFRNQTGQISWIGAPQLMVTPFRGKISMFSSFYIDTELHFMAGLAFAGLSERKDCKGTTCSQPGGYDRTSRTAITGTFGLGLEFFTHAWGGLALEWRMLPLSRNVGGFDTAGTGQNDKYPDLRINEKDRELKFNQLITVGYSIFLPFTNRISE
jgi:hypothetical protein